MKTIELVERIEGEAKLSCEWEDGKISNASIDFLNFRGFEYILENKPILDALVYTPRICGICGQAHLKATVEAIENIYENKNQKLEITNKAKILREVGLNIEIIDSHLKWFYMFILPDVIKLANEDLGIYEPIKGSRWVEASKTASETIKALAVIGGQWPHTSYMVPGGVVCDPTRMDIITMINYLQLTLRFCEKYLVGININDYFNINSIDDLGGDLKYFYDLSLRNDLQNIGKSHGNFISLGQSNIFRQAKYLSKVYTKIDFSKINEHDNKTFKINLKDNSKTTWSKSVTYNNKFYETGPLARAILNNRLSVKSTFKKYGDSVVTRVFARIDEMIYLLDDTINQLQNIDLTEKSYIKPKYSLKTLSEKEELNGNSAVEACRGSLYHDISIKNGIITKYNIITPTVWNLGYENLTEQGVCQKAIIGLDDINKAKIVLRSFDVCSVCTTH